MSSVKRKRRALLPRATDMLKVWSSERASHPQHEPKTGEIHATKKAEAKKTAVPVKEFGPTKAPADAKAPR